MKQTVDVDVVDRWRGNIGCSRTPSSGCVYALPKNLIVVPCVGFHEDSGSKILLTLLGARLRNKVIQFEAVQHSSRGLKWDEWRAEVQHWIRDPEIWTSPESNIGAAALLGVVFYQIKSTNWPSSALLTN
jgi:hypothetical protein